MRFFLFALGLATGSVLAADLPGDPAAGLVFARDVCANCHNVEALDPEGTPVLEAPAFRDIANGSAHNEMSLRVFFRTPHLTMPNLKLTEEETANVIGYILSLRKR